LCDLQTFAGCDCPAIFSKTHEQFSRRVKFNFVNHFCGAAAEACPPGDSETHGPCTRRLCSTFLPCRPASSSESLNAPAGPSFDEFLIRSEYQLTCGAGIDRPTKKSRARIFRTLPKPMRAVISARKEPICQLSPGRQRPLCSFPLLLSVCSIPARSPSGLAFPSIGCRLTPRGEVRASLRCSWALAATDGRCCGFDGQTWRSSSSTTWETDCRCGGERKSVYPAQSRCD